LGTVLIAYIVKAVVGLRVSEEVERSGLDIAEHGEEGYHDSVGGSIVPAKDATGESILAAVDGALSASTKKGPQPV
jgi:ammonium transporter family